MTTIAPKLYTEQDFWNLCDRADFLETYIQLEARTDGLWLVPEDHENFRTCPEVRSILLVHPTGNDNEPVLPFPFTLDQFLLFAESEPYSLADCSMAEDEVDELGRRSANARELALAMFTDESRTAKKRTAGEWEVLPYQRLRAYTYVLHQFLREERSRRKPRPTGRDFLQWLSGKQFPEIQEVTATGLTYIDDGHTSPVPVKALNTAIYRMAKYKPER